MCFDLGGPFYALQPLRKLYIYIYIYIYIYGSRGGSYVFMLSMSHVQAFVCLIRADWADCCRPHVQMLVCGAFFFESVSYFLLWYRAVRRSVGRMVGRSVGRSVDRSVSCMAVGILVVSPAGVHKIRSLTTWCNNLLMH